MNKDWVVFSLCLVLFVSGGVYFQILPDIKMNIAFPLDWNALSAVGTIGAVLTSLWLAGAADRKRDDEAKVRAELIAVRLSPIVEELNGQLAGFSGWAYFDDLDSDEPISDIRDRIRKLAAFTSRISSYDIEALVYIDKRIAGYLSRAIGEVESVINAVEREGKDWSGVSRLMKEFYRESWGSSLINAREFLLQATPSLEHVANKYAPLPDWSQIYADEHED